MRGARVLRTAVAVATACGLLALPTVAAADPGSAAGAAPLLVPRESHAAAALPHGRVLVVGGDPTADRVPPPGRAEVYDPTLGVWTLTAPYAAERRIGHTATALADGRVLVAGGRFASGIFSEGWSDAVYDPVTDTWTTVRTSEGNGHRMGHAAALLPDGRVLIAGGDEYSAYTNGSRPDTAVVYDPAAGTWVDTGPMKAIHDHATAVVLGDGSVLVGGGQAATVERWSPVTNAWTSTFVPAALTFDEWNHGPLAPIPGGALLVSRQTGETLVFSTATGRWRRGGRMRVPRTAHALAALPSGEVLVVGGRVSGTGGVTAGPETEIYDPATDLWRDGPPLDAPRTSTRLARTGGGDVLAVAGTADERRVDRVTPPGVPPRAAHADGPRAVLESHIRRSSGRAGAPVGVVAHLFDALTDEPVAGEVVRLYARAAGAAAWSPAGEAVTDADGGAAFVVAPTADTVYTARHAGTAAVGPAAGSELAYLTTPSPARPGAPERVVAEGGDRFARVTWLPPEDDGGEPVTEYAVAAVPTDSTTPAATATVPGTARTVTLTGLANDRSYVVTVTARTGHGPGPAGAARATPTTELPQPAPPPAGGTAVCGRLPYGVTRWTAAGSPYRVCPLGLVVPTGATLELDGAEVRFAEAVNAPTAERPGLDVNGGAIRATGSVLRGERGVRNEWAGVTLDRRVEDVRGPEVYRTGSTLSLAGTEVWHGNDAVRAIETATRLRLDDTLLTEAGGFGLWVWRMKVSARNLTVRDVGGRGVDVLCQSPTLHRTGICPVTLDGVTVDRAGGLGLHVRNAHPAVVRAPVVTRSGNGATKNAAARFTGLVATYGPGGDVEEVRGGGNGVDAVVLDMAILNDLVWRTPRVESAAAPAPLGFVAAGLRILGRKITFPAGSVVKALPPLHSYGGPHCGAASSSPCVGGIDVTQGTLDASAPGTVFTSVADPGVGIATCPSSLAETCAPDAVGWRGLAVHGSRSTVALHGATVRNAAYGLWVEGDQHAPNPLSGPGFTATVRDTTFRRLGHGIHGDGGLSDTGTMELTDVVVEDVASDGITATPMASFAATRTALRRSGGGFVARGGGGGTAACAPAGTVALADVVVEDVKGAGLSLAGCHPKARGVVVRRTGRYEAGSSSATVSRPAVTVSGTYSIGPGADLDALTGGGNGLDAVALNGTLTGDLAWVSPRNDAADHALGHALGGEPSGAALSLAGGSVRVPGGGLVAALPGGGLTLAGGSLDASAGGAAFVPVGDPLAAALDCRGACHRGTWAGLKLYPVAAGGAAGDLRLAGATLRGGEVVLAQQQDRADGIATITGTTTDRPVALSRPTRAVVTDSRLASLDVLGALRADVSRNASDAPRGITLTGRGEATDSDLVLRDNAVTGVTIGPGYEVGDARLTFGPGGDVSGNVGTGNGASIALRGVTTAADLTWVTPTAAPHPHPAGYLVREPTRPGASLTVAGAGNTLRFPAGAVAKLEGLVRLAGAALDATAGGVLLTTVTDDTAGPPTCRYPYDTWGDCVDPEQRDQDDRGRFTVESVPDAVTGESGGVALDRARVYGDVRVTGPVAGAGFGLTVDRSYVSGLIEATGTPASVTRTTVRREGGVVLRDSRGNVVRDLTVDGVVRSGLWLDSAEADVRETVVTGSARYGGDAPSAVKLTGTAGGTFGCLDVRGNGDGFAALGAAVTVTDSTLTGNTAATPYRSGGYDLDNLASVTTSGVWWGQAGGPGQGQVRTPAKHADTAPRAAPPPCAVAESAAPPGVPRQIAATPGAASVTATWQPPSSDGGSAVRSYRVTVSPGGATAEVPATARTATIGGLTPGTEYVVHVTAANDVGEGPPSRVSPVVRAGTPPPPPAATALAASAPAAVTYGGTATVTGRLTAGDTPTDGRRVRVYVRRAGTTTWGPSVATLTTSAAGTVAYALRPGVNTEVRLRFAGDSGLLAADSPVRTVLVRPVVTIAASATSAPLGTGVTLSGRVSPSLAGRPVRLERLTADGWRYVTTGYLSSTSTYRFTVRPSRRGTYSYRVVYLATASHAKAVSAARTFRVT